MYERKLMADAFSKMGRELYCFRKDSGLEVDFVTRMGGETWLVEVKAKAKAGNAKPLATVMKRTDIYGPCRACKLGEYNVVEANGVLTLPYCLAFMLR